MLYIFIGFVAPSRKSDRIYDTIPSDNCFENDQRAAASSAKALLVPFSSMYVGSGRGNGHTCKIILGPATFFRPVAFCSFWHETQHNEF